MNYFIITILLATVTISCSSQQLKTSFDRRDIASKLASSITNRSYGEGALSKDHNKDFLNTKNKYILSNGKIDLNKVTDSINYFTKRKKQLFDSIFLFEKEKQIRRYGFSNKKASKKAMEEIEGDESPLFLYDEVINSLNKVKANTQHSEINRISLFISVAENFKKTHLLTEEVNTLKNVGNFFQKIKLIDPDALEASNLLKNSKYVSKNEIDEMKKNNIDISLLNPPNGPIWVNNNIEKYDPLNEEFYHKGRIPDKNIEFQYKRMGGGQIRLKAFYLNKKGKKRNVNIKIGREALPQLYASQMARILGYTSLPIVYRKNIKVLLGDISYSEFTTAWDRAHVGAFDASASTFARTSFSRTGQYTYDKKSHSITLNEGFVEAYPSKGKLYYKGRAFRSSRHGLVNRREHRALLLFSALINLVDNGDKNIRMDAFRNSKDAPWIPLLYFNDTGTSLGNWYSSFNTLSINEFGPTVATEKKGKVHLRYLRIHPHPKAFATATAEDYKWLIRRMARISPKQLLEIGRASGFPTYLTDLYAEKIKRRINNLIQTFKLSKVKQLPVTPYSSLHKKYPSLISKKGKLKPQADNFDNNVWHTGSSATLTDLIKLEGSNLAHEAVSSLLKLELPIIGKTTFYNQTDKGLGLKGTREVSLNKFHGPGQRRIQIHDKWDWSAALGISQNLRLKNPETHSEFYLPLGFNFNYEVSHFHSTANIKDANLKNYKNVILPWKFSKIKDNLQIGESIRILESANFTIGGIKGQINKQLRLQLDALRYLKVKTKEIYIHRYSQNEIDIVVQNIDQKSLRSGFDIKVLLELAVSIGKKKIKTKYDHVRLDLNKSNEASTQKLYRKILATRDLDKLDKSIGTHVKLSKKERQKYFGLKFLLWDYNNIKTGTNYDIDVIEHRTADGKPDKNNFQIFSHSSDITSSKAINNTWSVGQVDDNDISERNILNGLNVLLQFFDQQNRQNITTYTLTDKEIFDIKDLMVFITINRSNNYIKRKKFNSRYLKYYSRIIGEYQKDYFKYKISENHEYFSPVRAQMTFQLSFKGLKKLINYARNHEDLCQNYSACTAEANNIHRYTRNMSNSKYSYKKRKKNLIKALKRISFFVEKVIGHKAYQLAGLRQIIGDKNIWAITSITGILPNSHPFAVSKRIPIYAKEIGTYQGKSPLKKVILKYQFFPKQNFFYDSLLPEIPY